MLIDSSKFPERDILHVKIIKKSVLGVYKKGLKCSFSLNDFLSFDCFESRIFVGTLLKKKNPYLH